MEGESRGLVNVLFKIRASHRIEWIVCEEHVLLIQGLVCGCLNLVISNFCNGKTLVLELQF